MITICHRHEFGPATLAAIRELTAVVRANLKTESAIMKTVEDLKNDVAAETAVDASIVTLVNGLAAQLKALSAGGTPVDPAVIDSLATQLESDTAGIAAAVTANTPAVPAQAQS